MINEIYFQECSVFKLDKEFLERNDYKLIDTDDEKWHQYYSNKKSNLIKFYPYSEHHGGGQPYVINIGNRNFKIWIEENPGFENNIRALL